MSEPIRIEDVTCIKATSKAICVEIDGEEHWIPQSQVHADSEVYRYGDQGTLVITEWIAKEKGLV